MESETLHQTSSEIPTAGNLTFQCNLCGNLSTVAMEMVGRELRSCLHCGSTVRMRQLIWALSMHLYGKPLTLRDFPQDRSIRGIGLTDPSEIATPLSEKLDYINTFYDGDPKLDINDLPEHYIGKFDFIISSEVFEHVSPPIAPAFLNMRRLLKPGGCVIFSVPYTLEEKNREHFPDLHHYKLSEDQAGHYLVNFTRDNTMQVRRGLVFHPGRGATLEMRKFSQAGLFKNFLEAGFTKVRIWNEARFEFGIFMPERWGLPFSAVAPLSSE